MSLSGGDDTIAWLLNLNNCNQEEKSEDIRMVYNGTYIGMKNLLWAHHFSLPMAGSTFRAVEKGTLLADRYIGDMCLIVMISDEVIPFCGVDVVNVSK